MGKWSTTRVEIDRGGQSRPLGDMPYGGESWGKLFLANFSKIFCKKNLLNRLKTYIFTVLSGFRTFDGPPPMQPRQQRCVSQRYTATKKFCLS